MTQEDARADGLETRILNPVDLVRILEIHLGVKIRSLRPVFRASFGPMGVLVGLTGIELLWEEDVVRDVAIILQKGTQPEVEPIEDHGPDKEMGL